MESLPIAGCAGGESRYLIFSLSIGIGERRAGISRIEFGMSPDTHKYNCFTLLREYSAVVARHVDAPATWESLLDRVIIKKRVMRLLEKEILSLYKFLANAFRQLAERLEELAMENRFHACL